MTSARNRAIPVEWPMSVGEDSADLCGYMISCDQHNEPPCSSYIRPCSRIDPNIDACALESARLAIPHVINAKVNVKYIFKFGIEQRADGKNYTSPEEPRLEFDIGGRAYIHLKNLFNGDKLLGDQMNIFLNENWEILVKEVGPTIGEAIGEAMRQILAGIFDLVPLEDAFPLDAGTATPKKD
uniref:Uncharacterized protein n=1 Tax=Timema tahoe TaxID=61484 RepID=A0A7R9IRI2_9NEOP|nr:unnamed protein product [Timema tahoe]